MTTPTPRTDALEPMKRAQRAEESLANLRKEYANSIEAWTGINEEKERAEARAENYRKDAEFGQILMRYIDRLTDPTTEDSLEKIVGLLSADVHAAIDAAIAEGKK